MSFWGASIRGDKIGDIGEKRMDVTITRVNLNLEGAKGVKDGSRVALWVRDDVDDKTEEKWILVCSLKVGHEETASMNLNISRRDTMQIKVTGPCGMDLVGYQALPSAPDGTVIDMEDSDEEDSEEEEKVGEKRKHVNADSEACCNGAPKACCRGAPKVQKAVEGGKKESHVTAQPAAKEKKAKEAAKEAPKKEEAKKEEAKKEAPNKAEAAAVKKEETRDFIPSSKFTGSKPGYYFRKDVKGIGYYKDIPKVIGKPAGKKNAADEWAEKVLEQREWRTGPGGMKMRDTVVGKSTGTPQKGKMITVHYTGKLMNGKQFDSSVGKKPFKFRYGGGEVIKGWDQGLDGMRVGGTRELELPPQMAYGARGAPPDIPKNATLKFTVQLLGV